MGFFGIIKGLFKEEKEQLVGTEEIKFEDLITWIDGLLKIKSEAFENEIRDTRLTLDKITLDLRSNLSVLADSKPNNPQMPDRMRQILEGNRDIYLTKLNSFLDSLNMPDNFNNFNAFFLEFEKSLFELDRQTTRSHAIISEFFPDESGKIHKGMKSPRDSLKEISRVYERSSILKINYLRQEIMLSFEKLEKKKNTEKEIEKINAEQVAEINNLREKENNLRLFEESDNYKEHRKKIMEKQEIDRLMQDLVEKFKLNFSDIEPALKKYARMQENKSIDIFLDNPLDALLSDKDFSIVTIINSCKEEISSGRIDLRDKKKDKILACLDRLNREFFENFLSKYQDYNDKLSELNNYLKSSKTPNKINDINEGLNLSKDRLSELDKQLKKIEKNHENLNIINELELKISENLGRNIKIKII